MTSPTRAIDTQTTYSLTEKYTVTAYLTPEQAPAVTNPRTHTTWQADFVHIDYIRTLAQTHWQVGAVRERLHNLLKDGSPGKKSEDTAHGGSSAYTFDRASWDRHYEQYSTMPAYLSIPEHINQLVIDNWPTADNTVTRGGLTTTDLTTTDKDA